MEPFKNTGFWVPSHLPEIHMFGVGVAQEAEI